MVISILKISSHSRVSRRIQEQQNLANDKPGLPILDRPVLLKEILILQIRVKTNLAKRKRLAHGAQIQIPTSHIDNVEPVRM